MKNNFFKHLEEFAKATEITRDEMREMVLTWYEPFKIYSYKVPSNNGGRSPRIYRDMYSVSGPSGNVNYDYEGEGYMIFYDLDRDGYRTIDLNSVYKIKKFGTTYIVK